MRGLLAVPELGEAGRVGVAARLTSEGVYGGAGWGGVSEC